MARKALLGSKIRRLRRDRDLSQTELARRLGISSSYLNLIEHNERALTIPLLLKLADQFKVDLQSFSQDGEARLFAELNELFGDALFKEEAPSREEIREIADVAPTACRAVLTLYRAFRSARDDLAALSERLSDDSFLSTSTSELRSLLTSIRSFAEILHDHEELEPAERRHFTSIVAAESDKLSQVMTQMLAFATAEAPANPAEDSVTPVEEVTDFIQAHGNHFPELEDAAAQLRKETRTDQATGPLIERLAEEFGIEVEMVDARPIEQPFAQDASARHRVLLAEADPPQTRRFLIARQISLLACTSLLENRLAAQRFSSRDSAALARRALAGYVAGALLMPYEEFLDAAIAMRYDIERLQHRFDASFEQVCHRLNTLQQMSAKTIAFHFIRVDVAGNLSKRFSASGLRIPRYGGACPRWNVHAAFLSPGRLRRQISRMPDGTAYFDVARTVSKGGGAYGATRSHYVVGIGCELTRASELIYSEGLDLGSSHAVVPIGVACRLCERDDCSQRAYPPILPSMRAAEPGRGGSSQGFCA